MTNIAKAAELLMQVRLGHPRLANLPDDCYPANLTEAYAIQAALTEHLLDHYGGEPIGYKLACTNIAAQRFLNVPHPFYGPLLSAFVFTCPRKLHADQFSMRIIEPEFGFELRHDLPPREEPYTREEVAGATGALIPSIEIVDSRYQVWTEVGGPALIADQATHGAWVTGAWRTDWRSLDLAAHEVRLWINDELAQIGRGAVVLGHPLNALTWLANARSAQGLGLKAGDLVTTGICVDQLYDARPGDRIKADFGGLGVVEVEFD